MVDPRVGDLLESKAQTLVNTVNCVGIMGKGIALEFKKRFPDMYEDYVQRCKRNQVKLGQPYLYRRLFPPNVINFPTKDHWRSVSNLADIVAGLEYLTQHYQEWGITSLAVPPLGCGHGQLEWNVVGPTLYRYLTKLDIPVELYAPAGTPEAELTASFLGRDPEAAEVHGPVRESLHINPVWVALVEIVARINEQYYHWPIGRTRLQKLAYFATESGLPTRLHFERGSYGPFSPALKSVVTKLVNNGLLVEEPSGKGFIYRVGPTYADAVSAPEYRRVLSEWEPRIDRITDLLLRIPTHDTEIAATVHSAWASLAQESQQRVTETQVLNEVKKWKARRNPPLDDADVIEMIRSLHTLQWIEVDLDDTRFVDEELTLLT